MGEEEQEMKKDPRLWKASVSGLLLRMSEPPGRLLPIPSRPVKPSRRAWVQHFLGPDLPQSTTSKSLK